jgi:indole-3-glycerol phosphate synthase
VAIYESGVQARADVERAALLGADVVLVGTVLSRSADPARAVRELCGVARVSRHAH